MMSYEDEMDGRTEVLESEDDDNVEDEAEQDPKVLLGRKIYLYNKQVDAELFRLQLKEGLNYEGALRVHYHNGVEENMRALKISNETTVTKLIPMLIDKFKPEMRGSKDLVDISNYYIVMILDGVERELELHETPLQIALDSLKSPIPPRFTFKCAGIRTPASPIIPKRTSYQHYTDGGDILSSLSKRTMNGQKQFSPKHSRRSKSTSAAVPIHGHSHSFDKESSPASLHRSLKLKKDRPISLMNSFVGNFSRSVKAKKKTTRHSHGNFDRDEPDLISVKGLLSPIPNHKEFMEAKLLQIYGGSLGKGSVYKSVLVSEISTTTEVIKEALDRYDISHSSSSDYCLCDVVGRCDDVLGERLSGSFSNSAGLGDGGFTAHHMRVLSDSEYPVAVEQYWTIPAGFERRFELRLVRDMYTSPSCSSKRTSGDSENYLSDGSSIDDLDEMLNRRGMTSYRSGSYLESDGSRQVSQATLVSYHGGDPYNGKSYYSDLCPKEIPYLVNLKPHLDNSGLLNPFGPGVLHVKLANENTNTTLNIYFSKSLDLAEAHVFQLHCYKNPNGTYNVELYVESGSQLEVSLNGCQVSQCRTHELCSGDIIEIGRQQHLFLYINPNSSSKQPHYRWLPCSTSSDPAVLSPVETSVVSAQLCIPFATYHQDTLLNSLISKLDDRDTDCKLLSSYAIASALHYASRHHSRELCVNVIQKTADKIQQVIWNTAKYLTDWDPDIELTEKAMPALDKTLGILQPVVYWIANTSELYNFIRRLSLDLDLQDQIVEESLAVLSNAISYAFQQSFYPVGKVAYKTILAVLNDDVSTGDRNRESCGWVMDLVVDLLQSILDLLNDHWVNINIISQFYSNVFYFLDHSLLSSLMEMIKEQHFVASLSGPVIRAHLNMLEGWACGIGLKEEVLENLARLSAAVDLLATEETELVQMKWSLLREQFPMLNSAQLHYLLQHYKLSVPLPNHWNPSQSDDEEARNLALLSDNFENYPSFAIPTKNCYLSLIGEPPESETYYTFLSYLRKLLLSYDAEESTVSNGDGAVERPSANNTEFPTPLHPRHRLLRRDSETESTGRVPSKEDVLTSSMNAASDLLHSLQTMSTGSRTESHEDMLQSSHLTGSEDELSFINRDHRLDDSDLTKHVHRVTDQILPKEVTNSSGHFIDSRNYVDSPVEFTECAAADYSVKVVDVNKRHHSGIHSSPGSLKGSESVSNSTIGSQDAAASERSLCSPKDPRAHTVVIPRGRKGFGIFLVEGEHGDRGDPGIFVQSVAQGSTAEDCKISVGDQILAIDGQNLDGADYKIAIRYLKCAEDEVMLTVLPHDRLL